MRIEMYTGEDPARDIYAGRVLCIPDCARIFMDLLRPRLPALFEVPAEADLESVHEYHNSTDLYKLTTRAQVLLREDPELVLAARRMLAPFDSPDREKQIYFDGPRLRVVPHAGYLVPAAAPAYYVHRDTWFGNPPAQWNWWLPVFDVAPARGFRIYPDCFARAVPNNSGEFDLDAWNRAGGFQSGNKADDHSQEFQQVHPRPDPDWMATAMAAKSLGQSLDVGARAGDCVLFSAQHLHGTAANATGRTRFSIELRTVRPGDGEGVRQSDNRSRGSTLTTMSRVRDGRLWEGGA